jgi:carboxylesterase type B
VLFYIHGGGFLLDSSTILGDENICKYMSYRGLIVVTVNYRLGFFGFLALDSEKSPGNYALWDMTLALKWVNENIAAFGGDPNKITLAGQSAGAVAVDYLR